MPTSSSGDLVDLKKATLRIQRWTDTVSEKDFKDNRMLIAACARKFSFIADAAARVVEQQPTIDKSIPEIHEWADLQSTLTPAPLVEDADAIWALVNDRLPLLTERLKMVLPDVL